MQAPWASQGYAAPAGPAPQPDGQQPGQQPAQQPQQWQAAPQQQYAAAAYPQASAQQPQPQVQQPAQQQQQQQQAYYIVQQPAVQAQVVYAAVTGAAPVAGQQAPQPTQQAVAYQPQAQAAVAYQNSAQQPQYQQPAYAAVAQPQQQVQQPAQQQPQQQAYAQSGWGAPQPAAAQPAAQPQQQQQQQQAYAAYTPQAYTVTQQPSATAAPAAAPAAAAYYAKPTPGRVWTGTVTALIPPNYGIVDGDSFYVSAVVSGTLPQVGQRVRCEAIPNTDGGQYAWRCTSVALEQAAGGAGGADAASASASVQAAAAAWTASRGPASRTMGRSGGAASTSGASGEKLKYNSAPPPVISYTADVALAVAANAVEGEGSAATAVVTSPNQLKNAPFAKPTPELTEEEKKRAEEAVQGLANYGDPSGVGAKLLAKMGFGAAEGSKGGLGRNEQGMSKPVDAIGTRGQTGLGFQERPRHHHHHHAPHVHRPAAVPARDVRSERDARDRDRGRERGRERDRRSKSRSRSRSYSSSSTSSGGSRSRSRDRDGGGSSSGRYVPKVPKGLTWEHVRGLAAIKERYKSMYIPSDFSRMEASWLESLPDHAPLQLTSPINFIFSSGTSAVAADGAAAVDGAAAATASAGTAAPPAVPLSAAEVSSGKRWSARVMLLSGMQHKSLYAKDSKAFQHPLHALKVVVTKRAKGELGGVGGPWEPADGGHPARDPGALLATARRTFQAQTGVDLSPCSQWIRFVDIVYLRQSSSAASVDGCVEERVVVFVVADGIAASAPSQAAIDTIAGAQEAVRAEKAARLTSEEAEAAAAKAAAAAAALEKAHVATVGDDASLDPNALTPMQLQEELAKRGIADKKWNPLQGKKPLVDKLQEYLTKRRQEMEQSEGAEGQSARALAEARAAAEAAAVRAKAAKEAYAAAQRAAREGESLLARPPVVDAIEFVQPAAATTSSSAASSSATSSRKLAAYTIDQLLDYSEDDNKEATFEVSLFAELFREMLQQRYGRVLLRGLQQLLNAAKGKEADKAAAGGGGKSDAADKGDKAGDRAAEGDAGTSEAAGGKRASENGGEGTSPAAKRQKQEPGESAEGGADAVAAAAVAAAASVSPGGGDKGGPSSQGGAGEVEGVVSEPLLTACRLFDSKCAGYLEAEDLEEVVYLTAQNISRRRVQALVDLAAGGGKKGRFSYTDHAAVQVAVPPAPAAPAPSAAAADNGQGAAEGPVSSSGVVVVNGAVVDVPGLQKRLAASEAGRRDLAMSVSRLEAQVSAQAAREAELQAQLGAATQQSAALQARLGLSTAGQEAVSATFQAVLAEVQAAQAAMEAAASRLQSWQGQAGGGAAAAGAEAAAAEGGQAAAAVGGVAVVKDEVMSG